MYKHLVKTLPLELMGLEIIEWDEKIPDYITTEEIFDEIVNPDSPFIPDFALRGYFHYYNQFTKPRFIISSDGPHILFISAMPKDIPREDHLKFRVNSPIWLYCWQDNRVKYLIQVAENSSI